MGKKGILAAAVAVWAGVAGLAASIPRAGVVEGYYGRPWSHEGRVGLMKFLGEVGLNTYIYGPKDDPYHHRRWREPYPAEDVARFKELLAAAKAGGVDFTWAIHLGDAFQKPESEDADWKALFAKLESMYAIGFRSFAAFFDDFGKSDAGLHAAVANRIVDEFLAKKGDCRDLIVCPNVYWGDGSSEYCKTLGEKAGPTVRIMWTGPEVCSVMSDAQIAQLTASYRRAPFVWLNWPCNDFNRGKLVMGPLYGVGTAPLAGFVLNPMENLEASKIGIWCAAEFAKDPAGYDPRAAWRKGLRKLYGEELGAAMEVFCEHNSDSAGGPRSGEAWLAGWNREESERLAADGDLRKACVEIRSAMKVLKAKLPEAQPALWNEIKWWILLQDAQALSGLAALDGDRALYETACEYAEAVSLAQQDAATYLAPEWDRKNSKPAITGTRVLRPMIEKAARAAFGDR